MFQASLRLVKIPGSGRPVMIAEILRDLLVLDLVGPRQDRHARGYTPFPLLEDPLGLVLQVSFGALANSPPVDVVVDPIDPARFPATLEFW
jgi:hypothetical protein